MPVKRNVTDGKSAEGMLRCGATPTSADETDVQYFVTVLFINPKLEIYQRTPAICDDYWLGLSRELAGPLEFIGRPLDEKTLFDVSAEPDFVFFQLCP